MVMSIAQGADFISEMQTNITTHHEIAQNDQKFSEHLTCSASGVEPQVKKTKTTQTCLESWKKASMH